MKKFILALVLLAATVPASASPVTGLEVAIVLQAGAGYAQCCIQYQDPPDSPDYPPGWGMDPAFCTPGEEWDRIQGCSCYDSAGHIHNGRKTYYYTCVGDFIHGYHWDAGGNSGCEAYDGAC